MKSHDSSALFSACMLEVERCVSSPPASLEVNECQDSVGSSVLLLFGLTERLCPGVIQTFVVKHS